MRIPRGLAVAIVFVGFAAAVIIALVALATVVVDQTKQAADRIDDLRYGGGRTNRPDRSRGRRRQAPGLARRPRHRTSRSASRRTTGSTRSARATSPATRRTPSRSRRGAAVSVVLLLFYVVLIVVIAVYMLLDMARLERAIDRRFPPQCRRPADPADRARAGGLRARAAAPLDDHRHERGPRHVDPRRHRPASRAPSSYALLFGLWTAFVEVIPYIGPWLCAVPPMIYALVVDPIGASLGRASSSSSTRSRGTWSCRT